MRTKYVNQDWLEAKVQEINHELMHSHHETTERQCLESARNYYVSKLVEIDELQLNIIEIEAYNYGN